MEIIKKAGLPLRLFQFQQELGKYDITSLVAYSDARQEWYLMVEELDVRKATLLIQGIESRCDSGQVELTKAKITCQLEMTAAVPKEWLDKENPSCFLNYPETYFKAFVMNHSEHDVLSLYPPKTKWQIEPDSEWEPTMLHDDGDDW